MKSEADLELERKIRKAWEPLNRGSDMVSINLSVKDGVAAISGSTGAMGLASSLEATAKSFQGITKVVNNVYEGGGA